MLWISGAKDSKWLVVVSSAVAGLAERLQWAGSALSLMDTAVHLGKGQNMTLGLMPLKSKCYISKQCYIKNVCVRARTHHTHTHFWCGKKMMAYLSIFVLIDSLY